MIRLAVTCAVALAAVSGCSSSSPQRAVSMPVRTGQDGPPETLNLRIAKDDGSGFLDAGTIIMTPQTQAFMRFMRVGSVSLTPDGRIVSYTVAEPAPATMPEGYEEAYASIVTDRYGRLLDWESPQAEPPPAQP